MTPDDLLKASGDARHVREGHRRGAGRPPSIPEAHFATILQLRAEGYGYRSISNALLGLGIVAVHTTVRRFLRREGTYAKASVPEEHSK